MTIDLKAIRGRAAAGVQSNQVSESPMGAEAALDRLQDDVDQLLALVDRMRPHLDCKKSCGTWDARRRCTCGLNDLLRDLDGDARGGGR